MQSLPTVLLRHTTRIGSHYDWLLANPRDPMGLLWTARCDLSSSHWLRAGRFMLQAIQPHRRVYLNYQGAISGGRGSVLRVDEGDFVPRLWTPRRMMLDVKLIHCQAEVELKRVATDRWQARVRSVEREAPEPRAVDAAV